MKKRLKKIIIGLFGVFAVLKMASFCVNLKDSKDKELKKDIYDGAGKPYRAEIDNFYVKYLKRGLDVFVSFFGLVLLSPVFAFLSIAIVIDDPGPVLFTQKRVGKNKTFFKLHKFRSMKMCTPHDTPTHLLANPEQYITRVGKILRKYSLDELPQIWDIFVGNLSIVGPRPALWNQADLVEERDKYGANDVPPGLTGWAQINGRDELEIPVKARLDGDYCIELSKGSLKGFLMDVKCFFGTFKSVATADGVVEGGTGEMNKAGRNYTNNCTEEELIGNIGFSGPVTPDRSAFKKVLITGAGSYIGEAFKHYAEENYQTNFDIDTLDMQVNSRKEWDFSQYDIVYHVAGIAHADVGGVSEETKQKYYEVNTDLAFETAKKAKAAGVKEFIFMSSMIVYGDSAPFGTKKNITKDTVPAAANFYGDSKLQADVAVRRIADGDFKVIVLRPPMIYGKGSKGNYPTLAKLAKLLPVFPNVDNARSMLHIDNLCEFLCQIMLVECEEEATVLIPQNSEWTKTADMVSEISKVHGKTMITTGILAPLVVLAGKMPGKIGGLVNKAFGNMTYERELSQYEGISYQLYDLKESVQRTEGEEKNLDKVVIPEDRKPLVSLITVSYNSADTIRKTIESVLNQTYTNIEYRIVDGASSDDTVKIAGEYAPLFEAKNISYIITSEPDKGIYDAMNKGIVDASGEIIGIINSDDRYRPDAVETAVKAYLQTGYDYFYADINLLKADGSSIIKKSRQDYFPTSRHWNHPTSFVSKETYEELGVFLCEGIHDDFEFFLRVRKAGKKLVIVNKVLADFTTGGVSNDKTFAKCKKRCLDRYKCYRKNGYSPLYFIECVAIEIAKYILS